MERPLLAVVHVDAWAENRLLDWVRSQGIRVDFCYIERGDVVPVSARPYAAILVGGGLLPVSDAQRYPFMQRELELIRDALSLGTPYLGICLGAQLLAAALGEVAQPAAEGQCELGYQPIEVLDECMSGLSYVFQWHWEGTALPQGATLLARGSLFPTQAFRVGDNAYGFQFHPCVGPERIASWIEAFPPDRLPGDATMMVQEQQALADKYDADVTRWLAAFLPRWLPLPAKQSATLPRTPVVES